MNQSHSIVILACLVASAISFQGMKEMSTEEGTAMFDCLGVILCEERNAYEFRKMWMELGPVCKQKFFGWASSIYKMDFRDEPVFWDTYPDIECNKTMDVRRGQIKEFVMEFSKYYEKACENSMNEECAGMNKATSKAGEITNHYTVIGVCENGGKGAKKGVDQAQTAGGPLQNAARPGMGMGR